MFPQSSHLSSHATTISPTSLSSTFCCLIQRMNTNDVRSKNRREELIVQSIYPFFLPLQAQHSIAIRSDADKGSDAA
eukprot:scaffold27230_cov155-Skeletonema_dohrnii-CCMP3373.AAC.2